VACPDFPFARPNTAGRRLRAALTIAGDTTIHVAAIFLRAGAIMKRHTFVITAAALTLAVAVPHSMQAQIRRSAGPDGGPPGGSAGAPKGTPRNARLPYAGVWQGLFRIPAPDGSETPMPVVMASLCCRRM
jgi:hypothetical protein